MTLTGNAAVNWAAFDPATYVRQFDPPRGEDLEVVRRMRAHFADAAGHGVDVGTGANLYPALAMLTNEAVDGVELVEHSRTNADWLATTLDQPLDEIWRPYVPGCWNCATRRALVDVWVDHRSIFRDDPLPPTAYYDLGTMCCVAESITDRRDEFADACARFLGALKPGSPYACTFTHMSSGYMVGNAQFPAVPVSLMDVDDVLGPMSRALVTIEHIRIDPPLRPGWTGLIYAEGTVR